MSVFSGKCDIYDTLVMIHADGDPEKIDFSKIKIYAAGNDVVPLRIDCPKDLVPYYPYLESMGMHSDGHTTIYLSDESFVDREERELLTFYLDNFKKYYRKCKRNKKEFLEEECIQTYSFMLTDDKCELARRVRELGEKATIDGIHMSSKDYYRKNLYEEMIKYGYTEDEAYHWCFGYRRWIEEKLKEKNDD